MTGVLVTSIALWLANVLYFALSYWQLDRGGPDGRAAGRKELADFSFAAEERDASFQPAFADYLFDAFTTSTAFSPTDTLPLTRRAKMLMMVQSAISLVTLVVVAARAINILR